MAQFSMHAYDADVWLERFMGLQQSEDGLNGDIRYAAEAVNVETPRGVLQPHAGWEIMSGEFSSRVETMAKFTRRWFTGNGSKEWLVCAAGGHLYARQVGDNVGWIEIPLPENVTAYLCSTWSWVTYEQNLEGSDSPVDVLLMSNAQDGMIMVIPPDRPSTWGDALSQNLTWANPNNETWADDYSPKWAINAVDTGDYKFGVIERYMERIWGGAIPDEPDMLVYSRPYKADDWTPYDPATELPEDGAGSVQQPSWDGDSFTALRTFGNQLIAFKEHRVWRVIGVDPGEYSFSEQYGGGGEYPNTISVNVERILMASDDGLNIYDGMSVRPYGRDQIRRLWGRVNPAALDQMCAALFKGRYYWAVPVDGSTTNNAVIVYDQNDGTVLFYEDMKIESLLPTNDVLYATSSTLPGKVLILHHDSWECGIASGAATRWMTPWMDFGYKRIVKGGFDLYFLPEVQSQPVTLKVTVETEKKAKTKMYMVMPTVGKHRQKRLHFGGTGRRFRVIIETDAGNTAPWRLVGGLQMVVETDPD